VGHGRIVLIRSPPATASSVRVDRYSYADRAALDPSPTAAATRAPSSGRVPIIRWKLSSDAEDLPGFGNPSGQARPLARHEVELSQTFAREEAGDDHVPVEPMENELDRAVDNDKEVMGWFSGSVDDLASADRAFFAEWGKSLQGRLAEDRLVGVVHLVAHQIALLYAASARTALSNALRRSARPNTGPPGSRTRPARRLSSRTES
jgi:hypothetical protein